MNNYPQFWIRAQLGKTLVLSVFREIILLLDIQNPDRILRWRVEQPSIFIHIGAR